MPEKYLIFAYGSLINEVSLKKTVPEARHLFPARVSGFRRVFNLCSRHRFDCNNIPICVLNVEPASDPAHMMNGVCFEMDEISMASLLEREKGYELCETTVFHYQQIEKKTQAYFFRAQNFEPYQYLAGSKEQVHYLELCLDGSIVFGQEFLRDFKASTSFWGIDCKFQQQSIWEGSY